MNRASLWILATAIVVLSSPACDTPTAPSTPPSSDSQSAPPAPPTAHNQCASPTYTISGLISAHGGGPLAGAGVEVVPYPYGYGTSARTGADGRYTVCGPSASKIGLQIWRSGYATALKYDVPASNQAIDVVLQPQFEVPVGGGSVNGVIRGDEFIGGDDYFGGLCRGTPCRIVGFRYENCPCPYRRAEITLRWDDASTRLALYFSNASIYFPPASVPLGTRVCCSSPLIATYTFNADFDRFAIGFEQAHGTSPGPHQSQAFELTVRPIP
jgi:hypothetical protein